MVELFVFFFLLFPACKTASATTSPTAHWNLDSQVGLDSFELLSDLTQL